MLLRCFLLSVGRSIGERGEVKCMMNRKMMHSMNGADNGKKNTDGRSPGRSRRKSDGFSTGVTVSCMSSMLGMSSGQW